MNEQAYTKLGFTSIEQYSFPTILNLCVLRGSCPCHCVHCPVGITPENERTDKFGKTTITLELFKRVVNQMTTFPHTTLRIHGVGEPILWPDLGRALQFTSAHQVRTWLFTSLITRDNALLETLARYCNIIEVSVNSHDEWDYKQSKRVDAFVLVKENIQFLRNFCQNNGLATRIIVSRVESEDKQYDLEFVNHWLHSHLVDDAFIRSYHDYNALLANKFSVKTRGIVPCLVHWSRFNIDCDGTVALCFNELFKGTHAAAAMVLGNIQTESIAIIWQGEKLNLIRRAQLEKNYAILHSAEPLPCIDCFSCQSLTNRAKPSSEHQVQLLTREKNG